MVTKLSPRTPECDRENFEHNKCKLIGKHLFITFILIRMEGHVKFLFCGKKPKLLPTNGLKINRSLHIKKRQKKQRETVMTVLKYPVPVVTGITN